MTANAWFQITLYLGALILLAIPRGEYMARVFEGRAGWSKRILGPVERLAYRFPPLLVLMGTAVASVTTAGASSLASRGAHGFSEMLYGYSSTGNNNGSAFSGLTANTLFYNLTTGLAMLMGRYCLAVPMLAIAGFVARKKIVPASAGTPATPTPLFVLMLIAAVALVGGALVHAGVIARAHCGILADAPLRQGGQRKMSMADRASAAASDARTVWRVSVAGKQPATIGVKTRSGSGSEVA